MTLLRLVYAANVIVAGAVGLTSLLAPVTAARTVWQQSAMPNDAAIRVTGALWTAIAILSVAGIRWPVAMAPVLVLQLVYKGLWLAIVAVPAIMARDGRPVPSGIATFFLIWILLLPLVIPFSEWRNASN